MQRKPPPRKFGGGGVIWGTAEERNMDSRFRGNDGQMSAVRGGILRREESEKVHLGLATAQELE